MPFIALVVLACAAQIGAALSCTGSLQTISTTGSHIITGCGSLGSVTISGVSNVDVLIDSCTMAGQLKFVGTVTNANVTLVDITHTHTHSGSGNRFAMYAISATLDTIDLNIVRGSVTAASTTQVGRALFIITTTMNGPFNVFSKGASWSASGPSAGRAVEWDSTSLAAGSRFVFEDTTLSTTSTGGSAQNILLFGNGGTCVLQTSQFLFIKSTLTATTTGTFSYNFQVNDCTMDDSQVESRDSTFTASGLTQTTNVVFSSATFRSSTILLDSADTAATATAASADASTFILSTTTVLNSRLLVSGRSTLQTTSSSGRGRCFQFLVSSVAASDIFFSEVHTINTGAGAIGFAIESTPVSAGSNFTFENVDAEMNGGTGLSSQAILLGLSSFDDSMITVNSSALITTSGRTPTGFYATSTSPLTNSRIYLHNSTLAVTATSGGGSAVSMYFFSASPLTTSSIELHNSTIIANQMGTSVAVNVRFKSTSAPTTGVTLLWTATTFWATSAASWARHVYFDAPGATATNLVLDVRDSNFQCSSSSSCTVIYTTSSAAPD